ncbi:MAG: glycosyltransferase family 4 protein [Bryobacterales bacterium]|nr:glycosyltransferase family 4 protein [Bryobacterales bacterium]
MRILHIDTGREMRGGQYQVLLLHDALARIDCEQTLLAGDAIRSRYECGPPLARRIRESAGRSDLIHAHDAKAHTLALIHGCGKPLVVARRVAFPIGRNPVSLWKYRRASHFIAVSEFVSSILQEGGIPDTKISVVYDAAPDEDSRPALGAPQRWGGPQASSRFRVVAPNLQDPLKGRDLAVAACQLAHVELCLSDDLVSDLNAAETLLYLSRSEGLGSAILLAMTRGLPTVASRVGGIPELVTDGVTGLLVDNDPESIASALERIRDDIRLRTTMSAAAMARIRTEFSQDKMADRTLAVYRRVLGISVKEPSSEEHR